MRFVCVSDTHLRHDFTVPDGDVLLHAGDFTRRGSLPEVIAFDRWLADLPHARKVVIAGNHDFAFEREPRAARALLTHAEYLQDGEAEVGGVRIWGSPWQPWFHDWAFNLRRGAPIRAKWALIPAGIDVLITHGPPHGILDHTVNGEDVGCEELVPALARVRPRVHVFGHIHEASGEETRDGIRYVNASICDVAYRAVYPPRVFDLEPGKPDAPASGRARPGAEGSMRKV